MPPHADIASFGNLKCGQEIERIKISAPNGASATILTFGATLQSFLIVDREGLFGDIVLGHDTVSAYERQRNYFGSTVGRYANRISGGRFSLGSRTHNLDQNDGLNSLHGGEQGFDRRAWTIMTADVSSVTLGLISPDGEAGFPGNLTVEAVYALDEVGALTVHYRAVSDAPTIINLTNHSYFNLDLAAGDVTRHRLQIAAASYLPVDRDRIPLAGLSPVNGTPFDFRAPVAVGERLRDSQDEQIQLCGGFDHSFDLANDIQKEPRFAARLEAPSSGRALDLLTTEKAVHFYSGNFLDGSAIGKGGRPYRSHDGLCLETQCFPDTPNRPDLGSALLRNGEVYEQTTIFRPSTL